MKTPQHLLRRTVTAQEQIAHEIYLLKCAINETRKEIDFYEELLNKPKLPVDLQRKVLFYIEEEELKKAKLTSELNKIKLNNI